MSPAASPGAGMGRHPTPGAPALVSGLCGAMRAPGDRDVGRLSWGGLGARWAAPRQGGLGCRPGPRVAMGTGGGSPAPVGGGAGGGTVCRLGEGPEGARRGRGWRGAPRASPRPPCYPAPAAPWGDSRSASGLQARAPVLASAPTPCASTLSLVASVSPTVEGGVGPGFHARFSAHFLWLWDRLGRIQGWVISHPLLRWRHVLIS